MNVKRPTMDLSILINDEMLCLFYLSSTGCFLRTRDIDNDEMLLVVFRDLRMFPPEAQGQDKYDVCIFSVPQNLSANYPIILKMFYGEFLVASNEFPLFLIWCQTVKSHETLSWAKFM